MIRQGIIGLLEKQVHLVVVHEAANGFDVIKWFNEKPTDLEIDIVLMDLQMPDLDGWEATELLIQQFPELKIISLSSYDNEVFVDRFIACGGRGYLLKAQEIEDLV